MIILKMELILMAQDEKSQTYKAKMKNWGV
jgi:hypothetical protein